MASPMPSNASKLRFKDIRTEYTFDPHTSPKRPFASNPSETFQENTNTSKNKRTRLNNSKKSSSNSAQRTPDIDLTTEEPPRSPKPTSNSNRPGKIATVFLPDHYTFKDALLDAMSDVDAAAQWKEFFGQEIHIYPRPSTLMDDDQYARYVRAKLFESSYKATEEGRKEEAQRAAKESRERRAREEAEERAREQKRAKEEEEFMKNFRDRLYEQTRRRAEAEWKRKSEPGMAKLNLGKTPIERWNAYLASFSTPPHNPDTLELWTIHTIPWPTELGTASSISKTAIEAFLIRYAIKAGGVSSMKEAIKQERLHWHPDKFANWARGRLRGEYRGSEIEETVKKVIQILNEMWNEVKGR